MSIEEFQTSKKFAIILEFALWWVRYALAN